MMVVAGCHYRISANSFRGNYSFLKLSLFTVTFDLYFINLNSCQGRKLFKGGNYSRKYGMYNLFFTNFYLCVGLSEHSSIAGFGGPRIKSQVRSVDERSSQLFKYEL